MSPPPLPRRLPRRRLLPAPAPVLAGERVQRERKGVTLVLAALVGAAFVLFATSFLDDAASDTRGVGGERRFEDTRF